MPYNFGELRGNVRCSS